MSELAFLRPSNESTERERFLEALRSGAAPYEPQFQYADMKRAAEIRAACDQHLTGEFEKQARQICEGVHRDYGSEEAYCNAVWGRLLDASEVDCACDAYLRDNQLEGKVIFEWNPSVLVTMCGVPKDGPQGAASDAAELLPGDATRLPARS